MSALYLLTFFLLILVSGEGEITSPSSSFLPLFPFPLFFSFLPSPSPSVFPSSSFSPSPGFAPAPFPDEKAESRRKKNLQSGRKEDIVTFPFFAFLPVLFSGILLPGGRKDMEQRMNPSFFPLRRRKKEQEKNPKAGKFERSGKSSSREEKEREKTGKNWKRKRN